MTQRGTICGSSMVVADNQLIIDRRSPVKELAAIRSLTCDIGSWGLNFTRLGYGFPFECPARGEHPGFCSA